MASYRQLFEHQQARSEVSGSVRAQTAPELSVIVPTFNERGNVPDLIESVKQVLVGVDWEIVFVDDNSPDGTAALVCSIAEADARVRCIRRIGRRGLSGACLEGILASHGHYVAVIDADLQHDETLLPAMLERIRRSDVDLIVASRYVDGGSSAGFTAIRARISQWATALVHRSLHVDLSDPMSGFFMIRREIIDSLAPSLSSQGFKILLDILATAPSRLRVAEIPYVFRQRLHGQSKLDARIAIDFLGLLIAKLTNDAVSYRFILFCLVGLSGVAFHMAVLDTAVDMAGLQFGLSQAVATAAAIAWNFALNNRLTYRDQRLTGWKWLTGLLRFEVICSVGAISNVGAASWLYGQHSSWWLAGLLGALMGAVWNYAVSAAFVWRHP